MPVLPPRSTALCMFADALVEPADWRSRGVAVPGTDVKVNSAQLAALVFAWALWGLESDGVLTLALEERRRLGLRRTTLLVRPARPDTRDSALENALLQALPPAGGTVEDVVHAALGRDSADPFAATVQRALADGTPSGCFVLREVEDRGRLSRALRGSSELVPVLERFPAVRPAFEQLLAQWQDYRRTSPEIIDALVDRCGRGVAGRQEASSSGSSFD